MKEFREKFWQLRCSIKSSENAKDYEMSQFYLGLITDNFNKMLPCLSRLFKDYEEEDEQGEEKEESVTDEETEMFSKNMEDVLKFLHRKLKI